MNPDFNFYIFREGRQARSGPDLTAELEAAVRSARDQDSWMEALLRAGELECALADAGSPDSTINSLTESIASAILENEGIPDLTVLKDLPEQVPETLVVSRPEGFAYYALNPLSYAECIQQVKASASAIVVGIRSIGTSLSAVVAAELRRRGTCVDRFTVRPHGNPYDRKTVFSLEQRASIFKGLYAGAIFLVVDEGPGLSGSSFLSVAEALVNEGVPAGHVVLLAGHVPDASNLRAPDAARRWTQFRCIAAADRKRCSSAEVWVGAGEWRSRFGIQKSEWPGTWTHMERPKYLSSDGRTLWRFEGCGHYGTAPIDRAKTLAAAGFSPTIAGFAGGYLGLPWMGGNSVRRGRVGPRMLRHIAEYCAFRAEAFRCRPADDANELSTMLRVNWEREFGLALPEATLELPIVRPTIADGRMLPHKWIETADGEILKLDATSHGDDHFFPGPCDIAWDLAGAIVELDLGSEALSSLQHAYTAITGDEVEQRLQNYLRAYATFRFAWSRMAAAAMHGTDEEYRLLREYKYYRGKAEALAPAEPEFQKRNLVA